MTIADALLFALFSTPLGVFFFVFLGALLAAIIIPKGLRRKAVAIGAVLLVSAIPVVVFVIRQNQGNEQMAEARAQAKSRYDAANAIFQERCKSAGERIVRTVSDVEGVVLLKVRPDIRNTRDQFAMTDPYGDDLPGDAYIMTFLRSYNAIATKPPRELGYEHVDVADASGNFVRYTGKTIYSGVGPNVPTFSLVSNVVDGEPARFGVTYDDISTRDDRLHWIAGSSLRIVDRHTNEVIAERIGYMMDPGQGSTSGGSEPWERATKHACPSFPGDPARHGQVAQAARFATKVLQPAPGR